MATPTQRTQGRSTVQPNTLSGQTEPNTLSTMTGRSAPAGSRPPRPRAAPTRRTGAGAALRLMSWVIFLAVAFVLLSLFQR
jgi:hypothetical protein